MPEPKAQLIDPQGPIDVPGLNITGVTTATGGFVGAVQGAATGFNTTTVNVSAGIITATKFSGNTTGNVSGLADDTNINVGIITSTSFTGDLVGNAAGLSTTTANINAGIMSATSFAGNFTGVASGITGTPNIVVGIMTGTLKGDGSTLTGIAATNWITNNVTANSSTTAVNLSDGNVVKFTQSADTTVSFANTGTSNIVSFIRPGANYTITWPSSIKWNGGSAPTLNTDSVAINQFQFLTRDEGVTWYGWETIDKPKQLQLWVWGRNVDGQLGQNATDSPGKGISSPIQIPGATWRNVGWSPQSNSAFVTKTDGALWVWGNNNYGSLGQNNVTQYSSPVQIPGTTWSDNFDSGDWTNLGGSGGVKTDGTLWTWGANYYGILGHNNEIKYSSPVQVPGTTWSTAQQTFICTGSTSVAIKTDGTLWVWGRNSYGKLGLNEGGPTTTNARSSPTQIPGTTWSIAAPNYNYAVAAVKTDGTMWTWGQQSEYSDGQLGLNQSWPGDTSRSSPTQVGTDTTWGKTAGKVQGMLKSFFAIKTDGTLWSWGYQSAFGEMAQNEGGAGYKRSSPVQIPGTTWSKIACGNYHWKALKTDGTLWACGRGELGQLGDDDNIHRSSPVQIPGTEWTKIGSNSYASYAIKEA